MLLFTYRVARPIERERRVPGGNVNIMECCRPRCQAGWFHNLFPGLHCRGKVGGESRSRRQKRTESHSRTKQEDQECDTAGSREFCERRRLPMDFANLRLYAESTSVDAGNASVEEM